MNNRRRASMEDVADALTERFGGAQGLADLYYEMVFSDVTTPATRAKILGKMADYFAATTKQYGDRERLAGMSTEQIEVRLLQLLKKHNMVIPFEGVHLNAGNNDQKEGGQEEERQASSQDEGSQIEDRGDPTAGDGIPSGDMDK